MALALPLDLTQELAEAKAKARLAREQAQVVNSLLVREKAQGLVLQSALDSAQVRVQDSELELVRVKEKAHLRESELEMALDLARAQVLARE